MATPFERNMINSSNMFTKLISHHYSSNRSVRRNGYNSIYSEKSVHLPFLQKHKFHIDNITSQYKVLIWVPFQIHILYNMSVKFGHVTFRFCSSYSKLN
jgi:hypothetical protein